MAIGVFPSCCGVGLVSANFDAFGRLRVSNPQTIFDSKLVYDAQPLYWSEAQTGGAGAGVWSGANACVTLTAPVGSTSVRQTRRYFNYQPGKSQLIFQTFSMGPAVAGGVTRVGYFDSQNGLLLQRSGSALSLVRRSGSSTPTTSVPQTNWNLDPLDGSGPSGIAINVELSQILVIDFEWLGVGSVRMGFVINGQIVYAHQFNNANISAYVYSSTPNLPLRYEIDATAAAGSLSLNCICGTVMSEGGVQVPGTAYGYPMNALTANVANGSLKTLLSIRHQSAYSRVTIIPQIVDVLAKGNGSSYWELVYNPTFTTPATWLAASYGYCDIDTAGEATGGTVIASGIFSQHSPAPLLNIKDTNLTLGADVAGVSDVLSMQVRNLSGGNEQYLGNINWNALT